MEYYSVKEVAEKLKVNKLTVYRLIYNGKIKIIRFGRSIRIPEESLDEILKIKED